MSTPTQPSSYSLKNTYFHKKSLRPKKLVFRNDSAEVCYDEESIIWTLMRFCCCMALFFVLLVFAGKIDIFLCIIFMVIFTLFMVFANFRNSNSRELLPVFDKLNGRFQPKGWSTKPPTPIKIKEIDYLQIIEIENLHDISYELNAFMKDGNCFQIIEHDNFSKLIANAKRLAEFLALPLKDKHGEPFVDLPGKFKGPLVPSYSAFQNKHLVFHHDSINVQTTWFFILSSILVMIFGLTSGLAFIWRGLFYFDSFSRVEVIMGALIITTFLCLFLYFYFMKLKKTPPPFFDIADGKFYPNGITHDGSGIPLSQMDHLEILTEQLGRITDSGESLFHYTHELNIVLKDGSRYNIMKVGSEKRLLADAHALADRLSIPLMNAWDGMPIP